jgi:hypothetical protein
MSPGAMPHGAMPHGPMARGSAAGEPTLPGQDAFGTISEIVRLLDADPRTDWNKVDLERLRQHLIDMNEVVLRTEVILSEPRENAGLRFACVGAPEGGSWPSERITGPSR